MQYFIHLDDQGLITITHLHARSYFYIDTCNNANTLIWFLSNKIFKLSGKHDHRCLRGGVIDNFCISSHKKRCKKETVNEIK